MIFPWARAGLVIAILAASLSASAAQTLQTGFADFGSDQNTPIEIEADALEVQDKSNIAVFTGNVTVRQKEASLQTSRLTVHYAANPQAPRTDGDAPATPQNQRISRLEADGKVLLTANGQSATGDAGTVNFDDRTLALNGNVTLSQDGNVITGDTITVNLDTGIARVESRSRVRVLLSPGGAKSN
ncbi:LptA/OstA family protein [Acuticoccus mangrovi]|uniref:Lipopolysaccharide transport periplasmic protein LptA n=1 Tax=Acuticoccus mangrovi TaxID=2796142 RepID=A0A934MH03_9HYPH|nr:LptA/OstA family protein [Acuticoccus mangrovi]MBJ3777148.1 lipopolysaccharide transport periplasmic protein LptA [Acuticoccus mangrovi]